MKVIEPLNTNLSIKCLYPQLYALPAHRLCELEKKAEVSNW